MTNASSHFSMLFVIPQTRVTKEYKTCVFPSRVNGFPNQSIGRPNLNKEFKMNLHSISMVLMIFSFTEAHADVIPVEELDITKYLGLWYEVS